MKHAAFLRSINVGGRRVKNAQLIEAFEQLGLADVAAYQAAGNLVFNGDATADSLRAALNDALGIDVPVILRTLAQVRELGAAAPFKADERDASVGKVQIGLLAAEPSPPQIEAVMALQTTDDRLRFVGSALFWLPMGKMSESALDMRTIERTLGLQTWRTQGTLERLAKRFGS